MSLFVCAKCGCVDNTATSSYWMLTNEYMVDKFDYAKELQPYKGMGLCSECGRLATSPGGRDVVVPGKWHGKFPKEKATEEQLKHVGYNLASYSSAHALAASGGLLKFGSFTKPVVRSSFILELHQTLNLTSSHWAKSIATSSYNHVPPPFSELPLIFITN